MLVDWKFDYSLGIPQIDAEHFEIVAMIGRLAEVKGRPDEVRQIGQIMVQLQDHMATHCMHEECLMERAGYPDLEAHKQEHVAHARRMRDIELDSIDPILLHDRLLECTVRHILKHDRPYASFARSWLDRRGVREA